MFCIVHTFWHLSSRHRWGSLTCFQLYHTDVYVVRDQRRSKISDEDSLKTGKVAKLFETIVDAKLCVILNGKSQNVVITDFLFENFNFSFSSWYADINAFRSRQGLSCWLVMLHRRSKRFQKVLVSWFSNLNFQKLFSNQWKLPSHCVLSQLFSAKTRWFQQLHVHKNDVHWNQDIKMFRSYYFKLRQSKCFSFVKKFSNISLGNVNSLIGRQLYGRNESPF